MPCPRCVVGDHVACILHELLLCLSLHSQGVLLRVRLLLRGVPLLGSADKPGNARDHSSTELRSCFESFSCSAEVGCRQQPVSVGCQYRHDKPSGIRPSGDTELAGPGGGRCCGNNQHKRAHTHYSAPRIRQSVARACCTRLDKGESATTCIINIRRSIRPRSYHPVAPQQPGREGFCCCHVSALCIGWSKECPCFSSLFCKIVQLSNPQPSSRPIMLGPWMMQGTYLPAAGLFIMCWTAQRAVLSDRSVGCRSCEGQHRGLSGACWPSCRLGSISSVSGPWSTHLAFALALAAFPILPHLQVHGRGLGPTSTTAKVDVKWIGICLHM